MHQKFWGYKVEEKIYLGVRAIKRLNITRLKYKQLLGVSNGLRTVGQEIFSPPIIAYHFFVYNILTLVEFQRWLDSVTRSVLTATLATNCASVRICIFRPFIAQYGPSWIRVFVRVTYPRQLLLSSPGVTQSI